MNPPLTPHGPGFRFLDTFTAASPTSGAGSFFLDPQLPFFADHFPGNPLMPAVFIIEAAAQTAGAVWGHSAESSTTPMFVASVDQFRIQGPALPGDTLVTRAQLTKELGSLAVFEVECRIGERPVARGRLTMSRQLSA